MNNNNEARDERSFMEMVKKLDDKQQDELLRFMKALLDKQCTRDN